MTITEEGALASFYTVNKAPIKHLKVYFSPKQAGTGDPSPENVREINGWSNIVFSHFGKNLFDKNNVYFTDENSWMNGATIAKSTTDRVLYIPCLPNTTYTISKSIGDVLAAGYTTVIPKASGLYRGHQRDAKAQKVTITTDDEANYIVVWFYDASKVNDKLIQPEDIYKTIQIEYGPTATEYEPYRGQTHTLDWANDIGTVYGGYVDLVTGELVQEWSSIYADGITVKANSDYNKPDYNRFGAGIVYCDPIGLYYNNNEQRVFCSTLPINPMGYGNLIDEDLLYCPYAGKLYVVFYIGRISDHPEITTNQQRIDFTNAWLQEHPTTIVYKLRDPITHQLTPTQLSTLIGRNNIWSNADRVEIEYDLAESNDELYRRRNILLRSTPHIETASGNIAHFETDIAAPIKSAKISFSPVQGGSGTPSPTNVRPISGFTNLSLYHSGENLYVPNSNNKGYISKSGVITVDETSTYTDLIPVNLGDVYSFECTTVSVNGDTNRRIHGYNSSGTWVQQLASGTTAANTVEYRKISATIPAGISYIRISFRNQDTDVRIAKENIVTANWSSTAGTIYGGYVDLTSGKLVQTHAHTVLDGSFAPAIFPWGKEYIDKNTGETLVNILYRKSDTGDNIHNGNFEYFYADSLKQISIYRTNEMGISMYDGDTYSICLTLPKNLVGSTNETLALYLSEYPCEVVFTLKTPITHTLTPAQLKSLKGTNNIWSNANGTIEVKYWRH